MPRVLNYLKATTASPCRGRGDERIRWGVDHGTYEEDDPVTCIGISNAIYNTVGNASSGRRRCRLTPCCAGAAAADQLCRPHAAGRRPGLIVPAGTPGSRERAADHRMPGEEAGAAPGGAPAGRWTAAQGTARTGGWRRAACAAWRTIRSSPPVRK